MSKITRHIRASAVTLLLLCGAAESRAQFLPGDDATLFAQIMIMKGDLQSMYNAPTANLAVVAGSHEWLSLSLKKLNNCFTIYNNYLDTFRDKYSFAAEAYGMYVEVDLLVNNTTKLIDEIDKHPSNVGASMISKSDVYKQVIEKAYGVLEVLYNSTIGTKKMKASERLEAFLQIRPDIATLNKDIKRLRYMVRYTSFEDLWNEITHYKDKKSKEDIVRECLDRQRTKAHNVRISSR